MIYFPILPPSARRAANMYSFVILTAFVFVRKLWAIETIFYAAGERIISSKSETYEL